MFFKRYRYLNQIINGLKDNKIILLLGARQVGKTTLMKMIMEDESIGLRKYYINFDDFFDRDFKDKDELVSFFSFTKGMDFYKDGILFLDEIQNLHNAEKI